jgi:hypothetical protein
MRPSTPWQAQFDAVTRVAGNSSSASSAWDLRHHPATKITNTTDTTHALCQTFTISPLSNPYSPHTYILTLTHTYTHSHTLTHTHTHSHTLTHTHTHSHTLTHTHTHSRPTLNSIRSLRHTYMTMHIRWWCCFSGPALCFYDRVRGCTVDFLSCVFFYVFGTIARVENK